MKMPDGWARGEERDRGSDRGKRQGACHGLGPLEADPETTIPGQVEDLGGSPRKRESGRECEPGRGAGSEGCSVKKFSGPGTRNSKSFHPRSWLRALIPELSDLQQSVKGPEKRPVIIMPVTMFISEVRSQRLREAKSPGHPPIAGQLLSNKSYVPSESPLERTSSLKPVTASPIPAEIPIASRPHFTEDTRHAAL